MSLLNSPRLLAALALLTVILGRGASQGLPGVVSGMDGVLAQFVSLGALLSQLCVLVFVALSTRLVVLAIVSHVAPVPFLILAAIATGATTLIGLSSALSLDGRTSEQLVSTAAVLVLLTAVTSGALALKDAERRAATLLGLGFVGSAAFHLGARWVALSATASADPNLYYGAQVLATGGATMELLTLIGVFYWVLKGSSPALRSIATVAIVCIPALAIYAGGQSATGLMLRSTLEQLTAHPDPLLPSWMLRSNELWALVAVSCTLLAFRRPAALCFVIALATLSRSSADIPLYGVLLLNMGLALQLPHFGQEPADQPST